MTPTDTAFGTTAPAEGLYDLCMIERLCRGNQEQVKKMMAVFIQQAPQAVEEIKKAYANSDFITIKNTAHRIKPILSYYAIVSIEKDIRKLEALAKEEGASFEMEMRINKIAEVISRVTAEMKSTF